MFNDIIASQDQQPFQSSIPGRKIGAGRISCVGRTVNGRISGIAHSVCGNDSLLVGDCAAEDRSCGWFPEPDLISGTWGNSSEGIRSIGAGLGTCHDNIAKHKLHDPVREKFFARVQNPVVVFVPPHLTTHVSGCGDRHSILVCIISIKSGELSASRNHGSVGQKLSGQTARHRNMEHDAVPARASADHIVTCATHYRSSDVPGTGPSGPRGRCNNRHAGRKRIHDRDRPRGRNGTDILGRDRKVTIAGTFSKAGG